MLLRPVAAYPVLIFAALMAGALPVAAQGFGQVRTAATGVQPPTQVQPGIIPAPAAANTPGLDPALGPNALPGPAAVPQASTVVSKPVKKVAPPAPPRETALPTSPVPSFTPDTAAATAKAAALYAEIAQSGGFTPVPGALRPGSRGAAVSALRHRLTQEGDLDSAHEGDPPINGVWDADLTAAVKNFQERMGLKPTGIVSGATLKAINVPADVRQHQLEASAQRLGTVRFNFGERYVVVNIPSASVEAVEGGQVTHRYVAVVGDPDHQSPEVVARVQTVNLNPTWTVPVSIIKNEIIPHMRKDPTYLAKAHMRMFTGKGVEVDPGKIDWNGEKAVNYLLRQDSGASNSLGAIRIDMPNRDAVYMHDTPAKGFFARDFRFLSHGCVRVEGVWDLAAWLLEGTINTDTGVWDKPALLAAAATKDRVDVKLVKQVPVAWIYATGWADADGTTHFRDDVYGRDAAPVPVAQAGQVQAQR